MIQIRNTLIAVILIFISFSICSQNSNKDIIFNWEKSDNFWISIDSTNQKFYPTLEEIKLAKKISIEHIDSLEKINKDFKILHFNHISYYRQYVGYYDNNGDKIIYINAFCDSYNKRTNLKTNWIFVLDGGSCYYQIRININKGECFDFTVNGNA